MTSSPPEERRTMKGWGRLLSDPDTQLTLEEAKLHGIVLVADRLYEMGHMFLDIQVRLTRMEAWLEETAPGYTESEAYQKTKPRRGDTRRELSGPDLREAEPEADAEADESEEA